MNLEIDGIKIDGDKFEVLAKIKGSIGVGGYSRGDIDNLVARKLADQIVLERGPEIINAITNNQIINAVIMRVAGSISGGER